MALDQFGPMVGKKLAVNGAAFDGVQYQDPTNVKYTGPERTRRVSGAPVLQGPVAFVATWRLMTLDSFQALYTQWNLNLNTADQGRVTLGFHDSRQAGTWVEAPYFMDEPEYEEEDLYVRNVRATFLEVVE